MGQITPVIYEEVLPGDKFSISTEILSRLKPLQTPIMSHLDTYVRHFVPNRILWKDWETFISGNSTIAYGFPQDKAIFRRKCQNHSFRKPIS